DDLDVLVVDRHALRAVDLLHLVHEVLLHTVRPEDRQHLVRVRRSLEQRLPAAQVVAVHERTGRPVVEDDVREALTLGQLLVHDLVRAVVRHDRDGVEALLLLEADPARLLGDRRLALGHAGLEELLDTRQTAGDVVTDTALVERPHGELGARLTDRLRGDDTDGLADVHQLPGGHRAAVAGRAHAGARGAG